MDTDRFPRLVSHCLTSNKMWRCTKWNVMNVVSNHDISRYWILMWYYDCRVLTFQQTKDKPLMPPWGRNAEVTCRRNTPLVLTFWKLYSAFRKSYPFRYHGRMLLNVLLSDSLKVYFELAHEPRVNISRNEIHWLKNALYHNSNCF